ncbi:thyrotropin-releasing hormone-degrading ectoenzyme-like isoform X1 [Vespa velutina]|uniref:thyrotropin-releasing hormone-degrading ectoenzyme-like isoform X1 n=1 Tax=Vespa velutina TaxID=202808 RepID=UPI001FB53027|nr:thyrotropin-releasing hormone-degrading ectoenzyme-like isoform X1 [Vespa velutina]
MANHTGPADIAEVTFQAYARQQITNEEPRRCYHLKIRFILMAIVSTVIASLIIYWFINSILVNHNESKHFDSNRYRSALRKQSHFQLPSQVIPLEYTLRIIPLLAENNFSIIGDVKIQLYCKHPTKHIRLHSRKLNIKNVKITNIRPANKSYIIENYKLISDDEFLDIFLLQLLIKNQSYMLSIRYTADLNEEPIGLFRSKYRNKISNVTRWIAVSNFYPDFARRTFPCFDEPSIKTPFRISISRKIDMRTHSNSILIATEINHDISGHVWDHYNKTLPMSTYLVAFMVTDFQSYQINVTDRPFHNVFARKDVQNDTMYIGNLIPRIVRLMQNLTGFHYDLDKLDMIAVPSLAYSSMENWGLITFRENNILVRNKKQHLDSKLRSAIIASHAVAHQWFGNLVTPKWWSDVWLKEGFSSFFGIKALSMIESSWSMEYIMAGQYRKMFEREAKEKAYPLYLNLSMKKSLRDIYDSRAYLKGNCLVNMIFHFLGESIFFSSIKRYINIYRHGAADQEDLWDIFQEEIKSRSHMEFSMRNIMKNWTDHAGFPVVHVLRNNETGLVELTQERFYRDALNPHGTSEELWSIPLTWTIESDQRFDGTLPKAWMLERRMVINDTGLSEAIFNNQWILFNINQTGLYRVNYDVENWRLLTNRFDILPETTKLQILNDAFAMFNAGLLDQAFLWKILLKFNVDTEETVWLSVKDAFKYIEYRLWDSQVFEFVTCKLVEDVYISKVKNLFEIDIDSWSTFNFEMTKWACSMGHKTCIKSVLNFVDELLENDTSITDDLTREFRLWAYCTYAKFSSEEQWSKLLAKYHEAKENDKYSLAYALGCTLNITLIERYLSSISLENKNSKNNENQYVEVTLMAIANNPSALNLTMAFIEQLENVDKRYSNIEYYDPLVNIFYDFSTTMDQEENVKWLTRFKGSPGSKYDTLIETIINDVKFNVAWNRRHKNVTIDRLRIIADTMNESKDCLKNGRRNIYD